MSFKGIASAIHALAILRKRFDVRLKIAGDGEEMENLRTTSIRLGLEDFVEFSGFYALLDSVVFYLGLVGSFPQLHHPFIECVVIDSGGWRALEAYPIEC